MTTAKYHITKLGASTFGENQVAAESSKWTTREWAYEQIVMTFDGESFTRENCLHNANIIWGETKDGDHPAHNHFDILQNVDVILQEMLAKGFIVPLGNVDYIFKDIPLHQPEKLQKVVTSDNVDAEFAKFEKKLKRDTDDGEDAIITAWGKYKFSPDGINADFERFSKQHSWYKHLPTPWSQKKHEKFYLVYRKGEQPRGTHEQEPDREGMHYWFFDEPTLKANREHIPEYDAITWQVPIHCNAFLRGVEDGPGREHFRGGFSDKKSLGFEAWAKQTYPGLELIDIARFEHNKSKCEAHLAAIFLYAQTM